MSKRHKRRLAALVEPHLEALYAAAVRLCRDRADAEDLVQDVCLRAFEKLRELRNHAAPRAWLLRVQYNLFVDGVRRASRAAPDGVSEARRAHAEPHSTDGDPEFAADAEELIANLHCAWQQLTQEQRALLALHCEGYRLVELTEITGLPMNALKSRLHRARVSLGKHLRTIERSRLRVAGSGAQR